MSFASAGRSAGGHSGADRGFSEAFRCADGYLFVAVESRAAFEALARVLGHTEWIVDAEMNHPSGVLNYVDVRIRPALDGWLQTRPRDEAARELSALRIPCGPCNAPPDLCRDPHLLARNMIREVRGVVAAEPVLAVGNPVQLVGEPKEFDGPVPTVGGDTYRVLSDAFGLADDDIDELIRRGVVGAQPPMGDSPSGSLLQS